MATYLRILSTPAVLCVALMALKLGLHVLNWSESKCKQAIPEAPCDGAVSLVLTPIVVFLVIYFTMVLLNRIWGRNLFRRPTDEA